MVKNRDSHFSKNRAALIQYVQSKHPNSTILNFADDTVIVSLLHNNESGHGPVIEEFVTWCDESYLELNLIKTKDMIIDFRTRV